MDYKQERSIQGATKKNFSACLWGKLQLRSTCPEFILTCPDFFLLCDVSPLLWPTKGNCLLISSKYHSVKSLNVYNFRVLGSTLLARQAYLITSMAGCKIAPKHSLDGSTNEDIAIDLSVASWTTFVSCLLLRELDATTVCIYKDSWHTTQEWRLIS